MSSPDMNMTYYMWLNKVNSYIYFLINKKKVNISNFIYSDFFNNGFDPKITAILAIQNDGPTFNYNIFELWGKDLKKYLSIFFEKKEIDTFNVEIYKKNYTQKIHPIYISSNILKSFGYLTLSYPINNNLTIQKVI